MMQLVSVGGLIKNPFDLFWLLGGCTVRLIFLMDLTGVGLPATGGGMLREGSKHRGLDAGVAFGTVGSDVPGCATSIAHNVFD